MEEDETVKHDLQKSLEFYISDHNIYKQSSRLLRSDYVKVCLRLLSGFQKVLFHGRLVAFDESAQLAWGKKRNQSVDSNRISIVIISKFHQA